MSTASQHTLDKSDNGASLHDVVLSGAAHYDTTMLVVSHNYDRVLCTMVSVHRTHYKNTTRLCHKITVTTTCGGGGDRLPRRCIPPNLKKTEPIVFYIYQTYLVYERTQHQLPPAKAAAIMR